MTPKSFFGSLKWRALITGVIAATSGGANAADIFLQLGDIKGESIAKGYAGQIELLSYTQSFRSAAAAPGSGGNVGGQAICGEITAVKAIDRSSPHLIGALLRATVIPSGLITFHPNPNLAGRDYYTVKLSAVTVVVIEQTDQPDPQRIVERVVLRAEKFQVAYRPTSGAGSGDALVEFGWDCTKNAPL